MEIITYRKALRSVRHSKYHSFDEKEEDNMGEPCSTYWGVENCMWN